MAPLAWFSGAQLPNPLTSASSASRRVEQSQAGISRKWWESSLGLAMEQGVSRGQETL